jgi:tRNA-splicing endonuclease subunit Sen15
MENSPDPVISLTLNVVRNLVDQHDWTEVDVSHVSAIRPLIRGLPPRRLYTHPDDQIAALNKQHETGELLQQLPEHEWVLAVHLAERWTIGNFSAIFDTIQDAGPRGKRLVLATVHNDSTVVYYLMHEGMVKPRQN